jgi:hypothetical protein
MHVDGTSFAAPIVLCVIAQLLEVNPGLTPARSVPYCLALPNEFLDFRRIAREFGIIQPRKAILKMFKQIDDGSTSKRRR